MKIEEAIAHAKEQTEIFAGKHRVFLYLAIEALEEIQQYRAIGTDFEKVLKEKLSENTFGIISSSDAEFSNWLYWLKFHAEKCGELYLDQWTENVIREKCQKIADHYGYEDQSRMLQEECAELIQAVNKFHRKESSKTFDSLVEEMADVQIMIIQILHLLDVDKEIYREELMNKLDRQLERMGGV